MLFLILKELQPVIIILLALRAYTEELYRGVMKRRREKEQTPE